MLLVSLVILNLLRIWTAKVTRRQTARVEMGSRAGRGDVQLDTVAYS